MFTVKVYAAGDHSHGGEGRPLPNSFGAESAELVEHLLKKSGYTKSLEWECRIDKMLHCSHDSRPIRVVGYKPYGVSLRVKPKENATVDQLCTLLIPSGSGYSAKNLFDQLKANEKSISRHWRKEQQKETRMEEPKVVATPQKMQIPLPNVPPLVPPVAVHRDPEPAAPAPPPKEQVAQEQPQEEPVPSFPNLKNLHKDKAKLLFVLRHVHTLSQDKGIKNRDEFITILRGQCRWEKILLRYCSRAVNELVKNEYVVERIGDRNKVIGYMLSNKGLEAIGLPAEAIPQPAPKQPVVAPKVAPKPAPVVLDFAKLLVEGRPKLQELADASARLESNRLREVMLREQIKKLEEEVAQVQEESRQVALVIANSPEAHETLQRLMALVTPLPLEGNKGQ